MKDWLLKQVVATFDTKTPEECILIGQIEEELSRPVEPVAWMYTDSDGTYFQNTGDTDHGWVPLFPHPTAKPVHLSDDEIKSMLNMDKS